MDKRKTLEIVVSSFLTKTKLRNSNALEDAVG